MKKILVAILAIAICTVASAQKRQQLPATTVGNTAYIGIDVGYDFMKITESTLSTEFDKNNIYASLNIGRGFALATGGNLRPEISFSYAMKDDGDAFDYSYYGVMMNIAYDIPLADGVFVYPTAGAGMRFHDYNGEEENSFTWQAGAGLRFHLTPEFSFDATLRYVDSGSPKISNVEYETKGFNFAAGFKFWL